MAGSGIARVAITGIGVVSPFGVGRDCFWRHVSRGCSATRTIVHFDPSPFPCTVAAPVPPVTIDDGVTLTERAGVEPPVGRPDPRRYSKASLIGVLAAREAWADAGLRLNEPDAGVLIGSGAGGIDIAEQQYREFFGEGWKRVTPYAIPISVAGMIFGFSKMRVVSTRYNKTPAAASRPFDRNRDGFVLGEGAWMVVLEREERARARGARIYATVDGYGSTCDAYHRVQMDPDGAQIVRAMRLAIDRSGRAIEEIGYVNYHGTSTVLNDAVESRCVRRLFGDRADRVPGSSTKSMIGHPQGASGAAGIVTSALALSRGFLPPTINHTEPDPQCDLDFIPNVGRSARIGAALCNCLGFG